MQVEEPILCGGDKDMSGARNSNVAGSLPRSQSQDNSDESWIVLNKNEDGEMKRSLPCSDEGEEEKWSIPCTQSGQDSYEVTFLDESKGASAVHYGRYLEKTSGRTSEAKIPLRDITQTQVLEQLPKSSKDPSNAQPLFPCSEEDCKKQCSAETLGYCGRHFAELFKAGHVDIPTQEQASDWIKSHSKPQSQNACAELFREEEEEISESFTSEELKEPRICRSPLCYNNVSKNDNGFCSDCTRVLTNIPTSPIEEKNRKRLKCPGCKSRGLKSYNGLCVRCYTTILITRAKRTPVPVPDSVHPPYPSNGASNSKYRKSSSSPTKPHRGEADRRRVMSKSPNKGPRNEGRENGSSNRESPHQSRRRNRPTTSGQGETRYEAAHDPYEANDVTIRRPPNDVTRKPPCERCVQNRSHSSPRKQPGSKTEKEIRQEAMARLVRSEPKHEPPSLYDDQPLQLSYTPDPKRERCRNKEYCTNFGNASCNGYCNACYKTFR